MYKFFLVDSKTAKSDIDKARLDGCRIADKSIQHLLPSGSEIVNTAKKRGPKPKVKDSPEE